MVLLNIYGLGGGLVSTQCSMNVIHAMHKLILKYFMAPFFISIGKRSARHLEAVPEIPSKEEKIELLKVNNW